MRFRQHGETRDAADFLMREIAQRRFRRVEQWYARAASIVSTENVWIQPLRADMTPAELQRRIVPGGGGVRGCGHDC